MKQNEMHNAKMEALKAAWDSAKSGKDYMPCLHKLHHFQLLEIETNRGLGISHVRIVPVGPGNRLCDGCKELAGKLYDLDKELSHQTLPYNKCSCTAFDESQTGFCLCYYEIVFDDEI